MMRRPSFLTRLARAITALSTVWSLGCCGFEPLVGHLFAVETDTMMDCPDGRVRDADSASPDATAESGIATTAPAVASVSSAIQSTQDASCNCDNCQAPSPPVAVASVVRTPTAVAQAAVGTLSPSVFRAPLVPPPQRA